MQIIICKDYEKMSHKAAELAGDWIFENPETLITFPAGNTPVGMVQHFVKLVNSGKIDISRTRYVSLDEWVGLGEETPGSCGYFNRRTLLQPLEKPFADVHIINGKAADPATEQQALGAYLKAHGPLSLSVLGIGMNGHLGFNEEGVDFEQDTILIPLSPTTKQVMGKYFSGGESPEYGLSIGLRQLMAAKKVILIASGEMKADILQRALHGEVSNAVPASILQNHPDCTVVLDEAAASKL